MALIVSSVVLVDVGHSVKAAGLPGTAASVRAPDAESRQPR